MSAAGLWAWRAAARRRPVRTWWLLCLAWSWGCWGLLLAQGARVAPGSSVSHLPGLAGPLLATCAMCVIEGGWPALAAWWRAALRWPRPLVPSLAWAASPLLAAAALWALLHAAGRPLPALADFNSYPGTAAGWPLGAVLLQAWLLNGWGEEGGWRGWLLPRWQARHGWLGASARVALGWGLWHAPLFLLNTRMHTLLGPALLGWALGLLAGSLCLAWLWRRSGSVVLLATWHTAFNLVVATTPGQGVVAAVLSTVVMALAAWVAWCWWHGR